jgi:hypothetical protein
MSRTEHINAPHEAQDIVLFVHGFGVRWDSRGMFTDIRDILPTSWGSVLFDFYEITENDTYVTTFNDQVTKLKDIYSNILNRFPKSKVHIIAHSMGCIVTAVANLHVKGKVILLAPPENFGARLEEYFRSVPGSRRDGKYLTVPRKDGTITHIPQSFFNSLKPINPEEAIVSFSKANRVSIVQTTNDEVIGKTSYSKLKGNPNIMIRDMAADHNFTGEYREKLITYIKKALEL